MPWGPWPPPPEALPSPVVDNHCHLEWPAGEPARDVERHLADAAAVGVTRVVQIGCEIDSARWTAHAVARYPAMVGGVSLHPNEAPIHARGEHASGLSYDDAFREIAALATGERIRVIGETGLDYFRTGEDGRDAQVRAFRDHLALAKELGKPLQIHDRDAHEDILRVLDADGAPEATVLHCFSGDAHFASACIARGFYLSFAGTVTFKNAPHLRAAAALCPASRLLAETDAPFLTPHPHRGSTNAPAMVAVTVRALARARGDEVGALCETINRTSEALYGPW